MVTIKLDDIAILNIRGVDFNGIINEISKSDAINLLQNANLNEERGVL